MPQINSLEGMASILNISYETLITALKSLGVLNQSGTPKKKWIDEGYFYPDGSIRNYNGLKNLICSKLGL